MRPAPIFVSRAHAGLFKLLNKYPLVFVVGTKHPLAPVKGKDGLSKQVYRNSGPFLALERPRPQGRDSKECGATRLASAAGTEAAGSDGTQ